MLQNGKYLFQFNKCSLSEASAVNQWANRTDETCYVTESLYQTNLLRIGEKLSFVLREGNDLLSGIDP